MGFTPVVSMRRGCKKGFLCASKLGRRARTVSKFNGFYLEMRRAGLLAYLDTLRVRHRDDPCLHAWFVEFVWRGVDS